MILLASFLCPAPACCSEASQRCEALRRDMADKQARVSEYMGMLQKLNGEKDNEVIGVMKQKISELKEQVSKLERDIAGCDGKKSDATSQGLGVVKSDEGQYATARCGELRKKLLQLLQKVQGLRRRENSFLSEFTPDDKRELKDAEQDMEAVNAALKTRCPNTRAPKPFRRNPRSNSQH